MFFLPKKSIIITHNGAFHPDEVFAVAALDLMLKEKTKVIRTRDPKIISKADYVVDVGNIYDPQNNHFDHHQPGGAGRRVNGISYAAFGLVWKHFGEKITRDKKISDYIEQNLVLPIDAYDNGEGKSVEILPGVHSYTINEMVNVLNPACVETGDNHAADKMFLDAVLMAKKLLIREIKWTKARFEAEEVLKKSFMESEDKRIVIVNRRVPVEEYFSSYPEPLFIVYQYSDGDWAVRTVRKEPHLFESRKLLPESWAGKRDGELAVLTGVSDAVFCHNKRFLAIARSKEGAIKLAKLAL